MNVPKHKWWIVGVAVPIGVAIIGVIPWKDETEKTTFYSATVIIEQARGLQGDELAENVADTLNEAMRLINLREFDKAVPLLESAVDAAPAPALFTNLGAAHLATGGRKEAEEYFWKALARDPNDENARLYLRQLPPGPLVGAQLVNFSSQWDDSQWSAANILDGRPNVGWCS